MINKYINKIILVIFILIIVILVISNYISCNTIEISNYTINSAKLPNEFKNFKILQLSDMHNKYYGEKQNKLINKIEEVNPNIVVITGDMVNSRDTSYTNFFEVIENISNKYPIYYVLGNHEEDLSSENLSKIIKKLEENNVKVLNNEMQNITIGNNSINIYGLSKQLKVKDDIIQNKEVMDKLLNNIDKQSFNILLIHNPLYFKEYEKYDIDLILSGHVHGGIIRLPVLGAMLSPNVSFFPEYNKGEYVINNSKLIVSAGIGIGRMPIRIFNNLDIPVITLCNN